MANNSTIRKWQLRRRLEDAVYETNSYLERNPEAEPNAALHANLSRAIQRNAFLERKMNSPLKQILKKVKLRHKMRCRLRLRPFDWYEILDANGNETGVYDWFEGSHEIEGYKHQGFDMTVSNTDINGTRTLTKFDGASKSSYLYDSNTGKFNFLKNYDYTAFYVDLAMSFVNTPLIIGDQLSGALVNGFQGAGIAIYEGTVNGRDLNGLDMNRLGYKPALDITSTRIYNNGRWVNINVHGNGDRKFAKTFAANLITISPFKANIFKNKWIDKILSSRLKTTIIDFIQD